MGAFRSTFRTLLLSALGLGAVSLTSFPTRAQELKDELDALEDIPPDDLSGLASPSSTATAPGAPSASAPATPTTPTTSAATTTPPATDALPAADSLPSADSASAADDLLGAEGLDSKPTKAGSEAATSEAANTPAPPPAKTEKDEKPAAAGDPLDGLDTVPADAAAAAPPASDDLGLEQELNAIDTAPKADSPAPKTADATPPPAALTGVTPHAQAKVTALDFRQLGDRVRLTIKGDAAGLDFSREDRKSRRQVLLELKNSALAKSVLKRAIDTGEFDGPVALVQAFDAKAGAMPVVKVLLQLRKYAEPTVSKLGTDVVVDFPLGNDDTLYKSTAESQVVIPETFVSAMDKMTSSGQRISLNLKDADIRDVINLISRTSGKNFVLPSDANAKVTLNVKDTPWDQVLRIILLNAGLGYQKLGNVYRVAKAGELQKEINDAAESAKKSGDLIPVETRLYALSYAQADTVQNNTKDFLTTRGKVSVDKRTNTLVVSDIPETLERIARYIKSIDRQTAQVLIEGRVVEAKKSFSRNFGLEWGVARTGGGSGTFGWGSTTSTEPANGASMTNILGGPRNLSLGAWSIVSATLEAAESENHVKTIASPRIVVRDNQSATIQQGDRINLPPDNKLVDVLLKLTVTPQVTTDGYVMLNVDFTRDFPSQQTREISTRKAQTELLVESGRTVVVGGVFTNISDEQERGFPWLRSVPLLGALFRGFKSTIEEANELLMFISPRILNPEKAFLMNAQQESGDEKAPAAAPAPVSANGGAEGDVPDDLL
jgi:type IV pilus assembly protein PilQ